ncbi:MAG: ribose-phosphate diphosphokinase [Crenarchaeota archaeon]|nr:ribose-phosphate diphosphokinase [Thermoproteota archaeon]MDW8034790.1 ribose-phosphate diphosphokinase [Nitrososphaerota archaeon]
MKIIVGPASASLGKRICSLLGLERIDVYTKEFPDGEVYIRLLGDVKGVDALIIQSLSPPQDRNLLILLQLIAAFKANGGENASVVIPYMAYARQDRIFLPGENASAHLVAKMIEAAGADRVALVEPHSEHAVQGFKNRIIIDVTRSFAKYYLENGFKEAYVVAPDKNAAMRARRLAEMINGGFGWVEKIRDKETGGISSSEGELNPRSRKTILIDDIISTGGTIIEAMRLLKMKGASFISVACVHGLFVENAYNKIKNEGASSILSSDTVESQYSNISVAEDIVRALREKNWL